MANCTRRTGVPLRYRLNVGKIVLPGFRIQQMRAGKVRLAAADGHEPPETAHVARREVEAAVPALQFIGQHIETVIMTADHDQGVIELLVGTEQAHPHRFLDFMPFQFLGNLEDAIGPRQGGNDASPALEGHGDESALARDPE